MLSISLPLKGAESANYYLDLAQEDYYLKGGEPPGQWYGTGAEELGLFGKVTEHELKLLIVGRDPDRQALVQNAGDENRQGGWDLTFSATKSFGVLWSQADPATRQALMDIHHRAVKEALDYLESEAGWTRRGHGGEEKERAKLTFATFEHGTSRAQDPQPHTHALLINVGVREDGSTGSIESKPIFKEKMTAGAIYRASTTHGLTGLGFEVEAEKSWYKVKGVSESLASEQSKRRKAIEARLLERGESGAKAAKIANLDTREAKEHLPREILFGMWAEDGKRHNFGPKEVEALRTAKALTPEEHKAQKEKVVANTLSKLTERESHFTRRDFVRRLAEEAQGSGLLSVKEILDTVKKELISSKEIIHLGRFMDEERYSTREMVALEKGMLDEVKAGKGKSITVSESTIQAVLETKGLSEEQKEAALHLTRKEGAVQLVAGMAGTGKSFMVDAVREAYEQEGFSVLGAAPSGKAAVELQEKAKIKSKTVHRLLGEIRRGQQKLNHKSILIVDEAAMVATRQMSELVHVTKKAGAKLILIGDEKQLQSVDAGGAFKAFSEELGRAELKDIRRQKEKWARDAVYNFAYGGAEEALGEYAKRGLVAVQATRKSAIDTLIKDWKGQGVEKPEENVMLSGTNLDVYELNSRAQALRFKAGKLQGDGIAINQEHFYQGDRVLFTQNSRALKVENGFTGTITATNSARSSFTARLDNGKSVQVNTRHYSEVRLGYAMTTHKLQASTIKNSFVLLGGNMQDRELSYVQASRAELSTRFYVDKASAGDRLSAITKQMAVSHKKELAITMGSASLAVAKVQGKAPEIAQKRRHRLGLS